MSGPLIFIATNKLKPGAFDAERQRIPDLAKFLRASEPRFIAFNEYVNDDRSEVSVVQIHPDAASMEAHIEIVKDRAAQAYAETLDQTVRIQIFGTPSSNMLAALRRHAGTGVHLNIHATHIGGFTRIQPLG
jgi:head-tail adaptor